MCLCPKRKSCKLLPIQPRTSSKHECASRLPNSMRWCVRDSFSFVIVVAHYLGLPPPPICFDACTHDRAKFLASFCVLNSDFCLCVRTAWQRGEPTGCPTKCGRPSGLGESGTVECETGNSADCLQSDKPTPKQCPGTESCGAFVSIICFCRHYDFLFSGACCAKIRTDCVTIYIMIISPSRSLPLRLHTYC